MSVNDHDLHTLVSPMVYGHSALQHMSTGHVSLNFRTRDRIYKRNTFIKVNVTSPIYLCVNWKMSISNSHL